MVKCDTCLLANDIRYTKPPGMCEECNVPTPYGDKLCSSCSDSSQRCQACRSKRVVALLSVPAASIAIVEALAAHKLNVQQQQQQQQKAFSTHNTPRSPRASPRLQKQSSHTPGQFAQASPRHNNAGSQSARSPPPTDRTNKEQTQQPQPQQQIQVHIPQSDATPRSARHMMLATSPFHFQNQTSYPIPEQHADAFSSPTFSTTQLNQTAPMPSTFTFSARDQQQQQQTTMMMIPHSANNNNSSTHPLLLDSSLPSSGSVMLSPSGKLFSSTLTPLSPRMAVQQNSSGSAPQIRSEDDARKLVHSWTKTQLISTLFHYYCNWKCSKLVTTLSLAKFRYFASDAGLLDLSNGEINNASTPHAVANAKQLSSNRLDLFFTSCTRPLSGQRAKMTEEQFFEVLGALALFKFPHAPSSSSSSSSSAYPSPISSPSSAAMHGANKPAAHLSEALDQFFPAYLEPLALQIVLARKDGLSLRNEEFDSGVVSLFLTYEEALKKIFSRKCREWLTDKPRCDELYSHPLPEEGWRSFCRDYGFFPDNINASLVLRIFLASTTGVIWHGAQQQVPALSFDDFIHGLFQLAQLCFVLTPNALPIERIELLLAKIDSKNRELMFMPLAFRAKQQAAVTLTIQSGSQQKLLMAGSTTGAPDNLKSFGLSPRFDNPLIPYEKQQVQMFGSQNDADFASLYALFTAAHMSCARDLFNLYCNTACQSGYSETLSRVQWVRLLREAMVEDGELFQGPDADILFNKVLCDAAQSHESRAAAFSHGRMWSFNDFLTGILGVAAKKFPVRAATAALRDLFRDHLDPLLLRRISELQEAQSSVSLPLGAGINSAGSPLANKGNWGAPQNQMQQREEEEKDAAPILYPNHASPACIDVASLFSSDPHLSSCFDLYSKPLRKAFYTASWEGIEAVNGVSIPRLSSSLLIRAAPSVSLANQASWHRFLQQKELLGEHSLRRWMASVRITPDLLAHKQLTMLFREGNVGFDRLQNQFVLNQREFELTLLRVALVAFSGSAYNTEINVQMGGGCYATPSAKLELLFFLIDQNSAGSFGFRGFKFNQLPSGASGVGDQSNSEATLMAAATNMGKAYWERKQSHPLGVRALLLGLSSSAPSPSSSPSALPADTGSNSSSIPQCWGHGEKSASAVLTSPSHSSSTPRNFNTFMQTPRTLFATSYQPVPRTMHQEQQQIQAQETPSSSPTKHLFQSTPFAASAGKTTHFAANLPHVALRASPQHKQKQIMQ